MGSGFEKLCSNPRIMRLMHQIEKNILENPPEPMLYRCPTCHDKGVIVTEDQSPLSGEVSVGRPCVNCTVGYEIERGRARERIKPGLLRPNRRLSDVERHQAGRGDYSFLDGDNPCP